MSQNTIQKYDQKWREQLIAVWERSVRATHHFLKTEDIEYYQAIVSSIDFNAFQVFGIFSAKQELMGFLGVADFKLEMLFLDPTYIGKGIGAQLMKFALEELKVDQVDVNEQNQQAVSFYRKFGFEPFDRTELDSEGKNYPIVKMKRENN